jgi:methionyl-tRNA formyltransferase
MSARSPIRIALFGTASRFSLLSLQELAAHKVLTAVVLSQPKPPWWRASLLCIAGMRRVSQLERAAREQGIPVIFATNSNQPMVADRLRMLKPDVIGVAIYPRRIPQEIIDLAPLGAINVHPSLLPRHRGPLPLFWTYHADDRDAGVTVHHMNQVLDAGDIIMQERFPLPRGYPVEKLDEDVALRGALLLRSAAQALASGRAPRIVQDEDAATNAPRVQLGTSMVRFNEWDVERVWHFLAGLCHRFREPLVDKAGDPVLYQVVNGFERGAFGRAGSVEITNSGWKLHCRGGMVLLSKLA